jgi:hypothetical protein
MALFFMNLLNNRAGCSKASPGTMMAMFNSKQNRFQAKVQKVEVSAIDLFVVVLALTEKDAAVGDMPSGLNAVVNMLSRIDQRGSEDRPKPTSKDLRVSSIVVSAW